MDNGQNLKEIFLNLYDSFLYKFGVGLLTRTDILMSSCIDYDLFNFIFWQITENLMLIATYILDFYLRNSLEFNRNELKGVLFFCETRNILVDKHDENCCFYSLRESRFNTTNVPTNFTFLEMDFVGFVLKIYFCFDDVPSNYITKPDLEESGLDVLDFCEYNSESSDCRIVGVRSCNCGFLE